MLVLHMINYSYHQLWLQMGKTIANYTMYLRLAVNMGSSYLTIPQTNIESMFLEGSRFVSTKTS